MVTRTSEQTVVSNGHAPADVIGVDPSTFARGAFWDSSFAGKSLGSLLHLVSGPAQGGALPAIAVGDGLPDTLHLEPSRPCVLVGDDPGAGGGPSQGLPRASATRARKPLVVLDRGALAKAGVTQTAAAVGRTAPDPPVPRPGGGGRSRRVQHDVLASNLRSRTAEPQLWALRYVQFIGLSAGAVTICGLGLYFAAVSDRRRLSTTLARNMGLSRRRSTMATMAEIATMLTIGLALGAVLAGPGHPPRLLAPRSGARAIRPRRCCATTLAGSCCARSPSSWSPWSRARDRGTRVAIVATGADPPCQLTPLASGVR